MKTTWAIWNITPNGDSLQTYEYSFSAAVSRLRALFQAGIKAYGVDDNGCILNVSLGIN